jgi:hypothetical protein
VCKKNIGHEREMIQLLAALYFTLSLGFLLGSIAIPGLDLPVPETVALALICCVYSLMFFAFAYNLD